MVDWRKPDGTAAARTLLALDDQLIQARALEIVAELGLADLLADGPLDCDTLAVATSCDPDALYRMLRMLSAQCGVFTEPWPRTFALTPAGGPLRSDHARTIRSVLRLNGAVAPLVFGGAEETLRTGTPAFLAALGTDLYSYLSHHPEHAALFDAAMTELTHLMVPALLAAYDTAGVRRMVDVGGGRGTLLHALLHATPGATGIVFDLPNLVQHARHAAGEEGVTDRCVAVGGDFFTSVPSGADLYTMKWVLHNWCDADAVTILRRCRESMHGGAKLLVVEAVLPPGDDPHPGKTMDVSMLVVTGGRERTRQEYFSLLAAADLRPRRVIPTDSPYTILEVVPG